MFESKLQESPHAEHRNKDESARGIKENCQVKRKRKNVRNLVFGIFGLFA